MSEEFACQRSAWSNRQAIGGQRARPAWHPVSVLILYLSEIIFFSGADVYFCLLFIIPIFCAIHYALSTQLSSHSTECLVPTPTARPSMFRRFVTHHGMGCCSSVQASQARANSGPAPHPAPVGGCLSRAPCLLRRGYFSWPSGMGMPPRPFPVLPDSRPKSVLLSAARPWQTAAADWALSGSCLTTPCVLFPLSGTTAAGRCPEQPGCKACCAARAAQQERVHRQWWRGASASPPLTARRVTTVPRLARSPSRQMGGLSTTHHRVPVSAPRPRGRGGNVGREIGSVSCPLLSAQSVRGGRPSTAALSRRGIGSRRRLRRRVPCLLRPKSGRMRGPGVCLGLAGSGMAGCIQPTGLPPNPGTTRGGVPSLPFPAAPAEGGLRPRAPPVTPPLRGRAEWLDGPHRCGMEWVSGSGEAAAGGGGGQGCAGQGAAPGTAGAARGARPTCGCINVLGGAALSARKGFSLHLRIRTKHAWAAPRRAAAAGRCAGCGFKRRICGCVRAPGALSGLGFVPCVVFGHVG